MATPWEWCLCNYFEVPLPGLEVEYPHIIELFIVIISTSEDYHAMLVNDSRMTCHCFRLALRRRDQLPSTFLDMVDVSFICAFASVHESTEYHHLVSFIQYGSMFISRDRHLTLGILHCFPSEVLQV